MTRPILLIDGANVFMRSYCAFPQMSSHGYQVGGIVGFLKTLRKLVSEKNPSGVYIAWENGGSKRRRDLFGEYKANRRPEKLNRFYEDDIPDTKENRQQQLVSLVKLIKHLPVCQLYIRDCEGDDVIAYLSRYVFRDKEKLIVSDDKDFYQLLDEHTNVYAPGKKTIVTATDVLQEFGITCNNFALAKTMCGDGSDNIPGIKGMGFKTLVKRFPIFGGNQELSVDDVTNYCHTHLKESKTYSSVLESEELIRRNWQLVYLDMSQIAASQIEQVQYVLDTFQPSVNKMQFIRRLIKEGISDFEVDNFMYAFLCLDAVIREENK